MNLSYEIEIYLLGTLCEIYSKEELIKYLDNLISKLNDVPFEVIEASLLSDKNINDISRKLKELIDEKIYNIYQMDYI
ncbi:hypothetical protein [Clostridium baratii]|uniref:hypothetical protein n=1 Tax=Clostridium baratii TaxID=1561 RepID=UPI0036F252CE